LFLYVDGAAPPPGGLGDGLSVTIRPVGGRRVRGLLWQQILLPRAARADGLDVFFAPAYSGPLSLGIPSVLTVHDLSFEALPQDFALVDGMRRRLLSRLSLRASRRVLAVSDFTRREILSRHGDLAGRVEVVLHGADDDLPPAPDRDEARRSLGVTGPMLLSVGSILNRRRLPSLLAAAARLRRSLPDLWLEVAGENRTHPRLDIDAIVARLDLEGTVRHSGFVSERELALRYAAADAVVYLSEYEGFGLPVLEGLRRGLPVLTSSRPATGEIFAAAALTVDPADPPGIAEAARRLVVDARLRARLIEEGRRLSARLTWTAAAEKTRRALAAAAR
jgi:glycosyltransferase involved in cell wall biosynthesis